MLSLTLALAVVCAEPLNSGDHPRSLTVNGNERSYLIHIPPKYDAKKPAPVVLAYHGAMTNGAIMTVFSGLNKKADESGFIAVYPNGNGEGKLMLVWNSGGLRGKSLNEKYDDVAFTAARRYEAGNGYRQFFLRAILDSIAQNIVTQDGATFTLGTDAGTTLGVGGGYNHGFTENVIWGVSASGLRLWNATDDAASKTVCVQSQSGVDANGNRVTVADCDQRFVGPLNDQWEGQVRSDFSWVIRTLGGESAAMIGLLGAASANFQQGANSSFNVSVGPAIYPPHRPGQVVFTALVELIDIGNRLGQSPTLADQLRFRVYVGVPFAFLSR